MVKNPIYLLLFITLLPFRLLAWGHADHAMVAELAMSMLSDATRLKVERILNGMTPEQAANWMDAVRSQSDYRFMAPWHFVNIEPGGTYSPAPDGDIISTLNRVYSELQHMEKLDPVKALSDVLILFHLCGDLTQPLHVGYGSDKGGNTYQVNYNGKGTNLHSVWDSRIIESQNITLSDLKQGGGQKIQKVDFMVWLNEGRALLPQVYLEGHKLDDAYMQKNRAVVITQLRDGAVLLAACLNNVFGRMSNGPAGPVTAAPPASQKPANTDKPITAAGTITPDQAA